MDLFDYIGIILGIILVALILYAIISSAVKKGVSSSKPPAENTSKICMRCGVKSPRQSEFCQNCGWQFPQKRTQKVESLPNIICKNCKAENPSTSKYCIGCGKKIAPEEEA